MKWPGKELKLHLVRPREGSEIHMLGYEAPLRWHLDKTAGLVIEVAAIAPTGDGAALPRGLCFSHRGPRFEQAVGHGERTANVGRWCISRTTQSRPLPLRQSFAVVKAIVEQIRGRMIEEFGVPDALVLENPNLLENLCRRVILVEEAHGADDATEVIAPHVLNGCVDQPGQSGIVGSVEDATGVIQRAHFDQRFRILADVLIRSARLRPEVPVHQGFDDNVLLRLLGGQTKGP